jgi:Xaa-Pro dipeptidase
VSPLLRDQIIREFLKRNGLDAWIAWRPDELVMMAGYLPFWGASVSVFFAASEPVLFVPILEPKDHIPPGLRVQEYPWGSLDCGDPFTVLFQQISVELKKAGARHSAVGMSHNACRTSLPIQAAEQIPIPDTFATQLSEAISSADAKLEPEFLRLYLRKTPDEINAIRLANHVAAVGFQTFDKQLAPGVSEAEVAAEVESTIYKETGRNGIFHSRGWAMVQSGPNTADSGCFNRSSGRRLAEGDLVLIELATCVNGYWSDLTRTAAIGSVKPELQWVLAVVREAQEAAIAAVRPDATAGEIDAIARNIIADAGYWAHFTHGTGHHVGFRYHDPGFGIAPGAHEKLEPGMVITVEPGIYGRELGGGARMEDNVLVTESGHEVISAVAPERARA